MSLKGRLLVAMPPLADPNFDRSVVLVLEHGDEGALGLVLNRPSDTPLGGVLPDWRDVAAAPGVVFVGGPVAEGSAIGMARAPVESPSDGWAPLFGGLGTVDLSREPAELDVPIEEVRVYTGYAGWSAGQLEAEIRAGAWVVVARRHDDVLSEDPSNLWKAVLRRQRGSLALMSAYPLDPSVN